MDVRGWIIKSWALIVGVLKVHRYWREILGVLDWEVQPVRPESGPECSFGTC